VLEIKPAYSDDIGKNEQWSLTINGKTFSSFENRLLPNKYKVELSHRCYEALSFEAGINKDKREVFDIASHIKLKKGGLVLKAVQDGELVSEPVFVNGKRVGETPFSGSVPLCAEIELGEVKEKEKVSVELRHNEKVELVYKMPDSKEWASKAEAERSRKKLEETRAKEREIERRLIRLGVRWRGGFFGQKPDGTGNGSKLFDKSYADYKEIGSASENSEYSWYLTPGLTLDIRIMDDMILATEFNYSLVFGYDFPLGASSRLSMSYQTIEVPVLLKFIEKEYRSGTRAYFEAGFQFGFPVSSEATVKSSGDEPFEGKFSDFRAKTDYGLVVGAGMRFYNGSLGARVTYPFTKLDRYGTIIAPFIFNLFTFTYDFF
jgi:hypothetical protein